MPKYIFSQGTVRVERGIYKPSQGRQSSGFGVLIWNTPNPDEPDLSESTQNKGDDSNEEANQHTRK
jgi:hypothetical protein